MIPATNILIAKTPALTLGKIPRINKPAQNNSAKVERIKLNSVPMPMGFANFISAELKSILNFCKPCPKNIILAEKTLNINKLISFIETPSNVFIR